MNISNNSISKYFFAPTMLYKNFYLALAVLFSISLKINLSAQATLFVFPFTGNLNVSTDGAAGVPTAALSGGFPATYAASSGGCVSGTGQAIGSTTQVWNGGEAITFTVANTTGFAGLNFSFCTKGQMSLNNVIVEANVGGGAFVTIMPAFEPAATFTSYSAPLPSGQFDNANAIVTIRIVKSGGSSGNNKDWLIDEARLTASSGLPVELASFKAVFEKQAVTLSWQTSTELNNDKFIIETSTEGEVFNRIGEIDGAGTTTETHNYTFTHHTPSAGMNYYRLKQVDFDGTFEYSKVIVINAPGSKDIFAFPNPAKDKISIQYDHSKGTGNIQLYDAMGRRIHTTIGGYAGNYEVKLPEGLARGMYWLKVERGGKVQAVPVMKE